MNIYLALTIVALAVVASCNAIGLKDSVNLCNDDSGVSAAEIAFIKQNKVTGASKNVKDWVWCYYTNLNLFLRQGNDASEKLSRASFIASYPSKLLSGNQIILNCNAQAKVSGMVTTEQAWNFHTCLLQNDFKV